MKDPTPRRPLDVNRLQNATHWSRQNLEKWIADAELAWVDRERKQREAEHRCRWCWYAHRSHLAGQAFTKRDCDSCGVEQQFSSTYTLPLCAECAAALGLCRECCADIDLCRRTKLERKKGRR